MQSRHGQVVVRAFGEWPSRGWRLYAFDIYCSMFTFRHLFRMTARAGFYRQLQNLLTVKSCTVNIERILQKRKDMPDTHNPVTFSL